MRERDGSHEGKEVRERERQGKVLTVSVLELVLPSCLAEQKVSEEEGSMFALALSPSP